MNAVDTRHEAEVATGRRPTRSLAKLWAAGTGLAVLLVAATYLLANEIAGPFVVAGTGEITLDNVTGLTIFGGTAGAAFAYVIGRFARRPRATFVATTLIALAGYAVVPFTAADSLESAIWLNIFHLVVAIPVIGMLALYLPEDQAPNGA